MPERDDTVGEQAQAPARPSVWHRTAGERDQARLDRCVFKETKTRCGPRCYKPARMSHH